MAHHEFSRPEYGPFPDSYVLPSPDAEQLYDAYVTAFSEVGPEQADQVVTMHFATMEGDHIEVTRTPAMREAQTKTGIVLTALQRVVSKKLGMHPSTYDPYKYTVTATAAGSNESVRFFTPAGPKYVIGKRIEHATWNRADMLTDELIDEAYSVQRKIERSTCITDDEWNEVKLMGPCTEICGEEAKKVHDAVAPTRKAILAHTKEPKILEGGEFTSSLGILADQNAGRWTIEAVNAILPVSGEGREVTRILFKHYPFEDSMSPGNYFIVSIGIVPGANTPLVVYRLVDGENEHQHLPAYLDKHQRAAVLESIRRQVKPENLRDID